MQASTFQQSDQPRRAAATAMIAGLAATTMLFAALLSAYVVRRGISNDWVPLNIPVQLSYSIVPAAAISVLIEIVRRRFPERSTGLVLVAVAAGLLFTGLHLQAWQQLVQFRSASTDFLFVISVLLVLYAVSGSFALFVTGFRRTPSTVLAGYWHYLNAVWALLLAILYFYR